jgi:hypothetical protein
MCRRRLLLFALLTVLVVAALWATMGWRRPSAITRENETRLRVGMTLDKVEAILGGPPRDERSGPTELDPDAYTTLKPDPPPPAKVSPISEWFSDEVMIRVMFDADGRAEWISTCPLRRTYPGLPATARHWLRF